MGQFHEGKALGSIVSWIEACKYLKLGRDSHDPGNLCCLGRAPSASRDIQTQLVLSQTMFLMRIISYGQQGPWLNVQV